MTLILNTFLHISTMHHTSPCEIAIINECQTVKDTLCIQYTTIQTPILTIHVNTSHIVVQLVSKPLCCLVTVTLLFQNLMFPWPRPLPFDLIFTSLFICSTQPLRGLQPSAQEWFSQSIHVLCWCHRLSVLIFSCSDFLVGVGCLVLVSLVVLCLCRRVFSHGFDFLPSSWPNSTSNVLTSLLHTSSTHMGPPLGNLSPQTSNSHSYQILWWLWFFFSHSSIKDAVHIHHPFGCCSPPTSFHHCPTLLLLLRRGYFSGTQPPSAASHSFLSADCRMSPSLTLFVLSAAKRERPEQNARLLLAASTSPSGPPSAPPYARL